MNKENKKIIYRFLFLILLFVFAYTYNYIDEHYNMNKSITEFRTEEVLNNSQSMEESNNDFFVDKDSAKELKIYFVDVGQADCILIQYNRENVLVDAGNNADGKKIVDYFHTLGINSFSYVFGTHAHEDHIGGMDDIISNFSIQHFYMPDVITTTKTFEDVLDALEKKNVIFETPKIDDNFSLSDVSLKVLAVGDDKKDLNNSSIVLKVIYKNTSYLLMGDATNEVEKTILDKDLKSDVLKVGHHGSQYSSSAHFLKKVEPKYAVIQVGKNNKYNHPRPITIEKLEKLGTKIYRTDEDGTVIITSDGNNILFNSIQTDTNGG